VSVRSDFMSPCTMNSPFRGLGAACRIVNPSASGRVVDGWLLANDPS
jgi:hypothetical protein